MTAKPPTPTPALSRRTESDHGAPRKPVVPTPPALVTVIAMVTGATTKNLAVEDLKARIEELGDPAN